MPSTVGDPRSRGKRGSFVPRDRSEVLVDALMREVAGIKARADGKAAAALARKHVDGGGVPQAVIAERFLRFPKASFVYAIEN